MGMWVFAVCRLLWYGHVFVPLHRVKGVSSVLNMIFIVFVSLPALFFSLYSVAYWSGLSCSFLMTYSMVRFVLILFTTPIDVVCCGGCFCGDMFGECRFV